MAMENIFSKASEFNQSDKISIKEKGVVFTDRTTANFIIEKLKPTITDKICEPSVGKGIFILCLLEYLSNRYSKDEVIHFIKNNLFAYDINPEYIKTTKDLINEYLDTDIDMPNIKVGDFLFMDQQNYDIIFGNPPYIRKQNLPEEYRNIISNDFLTMKGNSDIYYAFIEKSLILSKKIGFIIPNSFLTNTSGKTIRNVLNGRLNYIYNNELYKVWKDIATYTCIIICGENSDEVIYETASGFGNYNNIETSKENKFSDLINSVYLGVATLCNPVFIQDKFPFESEDYIKPIYKASTDTWMEAIYPYNKLGEIIEEDILKLDNNVYNHLLENKEVLLKRDAGKAIQYPNWYQYGRKQGLLREPQGITISIPLVIHEAKDIKATVLDNALCLSGIVIDLPKENIEKVIAILNSDDFRSFISHRNQKMIGKGGDYLKIKSKDIKEYSF